MLFLALALAGAPVAATAKEKRDTAPAAMQKLMENCDAHKFETVVEVTVEGQVKHSRVKLCGTEGQSDADWLRTLKDAVKKTTANEEMPKPVRDQIVTALTAEIDRLTGAASLPPPRSSAKTSALDGLSALPPLPAPKQAETAAVLPPPRLVPPSSRASDYAALPPLPTTPPPPTHVLAGGLGVAIPMLPIPKMSFACFTPGEGAEGPCTDFTRDTFVTVRADEDLPAGTSVRFVRNGSTQADVQLAQLKRGRAIRFALPPEVCSRVTNGSLELRIVRTVAALPTGQEVGSDGPYTLRC
jgi:hypothetical protein